MNKRRYNQEKYIPYTAEEKEQLRQMEIERDSADRASDARDLENLHPAYKPMNQAFIGRNGYQPRDENMTDFVLDQITTMAAKSSETVKTELRTIYRDIRNRGGDAYAEHKSRLIELNTK